MKRSSVTATVIAIQIATAIAGAALSGGCIPIGVRGTSIGATQSAPVAAATAIRPAPSASGDNDRIV